MKTGRLLALLALLLAVPLLPVCAQEEPDQDYYEEDEAAAEQEPAPAPKPAPKPAPAQYLGYSVSEISGKVDYQADGAASWKTLERKTLPKLGDRDILKTGDKSYVIFSAPGKCALRLESSSTLMLDGASKTPAAMSLVKGTVLVRCTGGQEAAVKNSLFSAQVNGAAAGVSYDFDTSIGAAAKYNPPAPAQGARDDKAVSVPGILKIVLPPGEDGKTFPLSVLDAGQQVTVSRQTREMQPIAMQTFFSDYADEAAALSVPVVEKAKPKTEAPKEKKVAVKKKPVVPKLELGGFDTKRQRERESEDTNSFKYKYKKTAQE